VTAKVSTDKQNSFYQRRVKQEVDLTIAFMPPLPWGGGGVLLYVGYIGMCRGTGYRRIFEVLDPQSGSFLHLLASCSRCDP